MNNNPSYLTNRWFEINKRAREHPVQVMLDSDIDSEKYRNFIIAAGRRSFKTERFAKRLLIKSCVRSRNYSKRYFAGAPTRQQAKEIFWDDFKKLSHPEFVLNVNETSLKITFVNGSTLRVIGLKEFKRVQGQLMHGIVLSKYQDCDPGVYNESIEPMINDTRGWCIKEGRPFGKNHFFDDFLKGKKKQKGWSSYHWTSEDILSAEQIEEAKANLAKPDYEREYKASFETATQRPYYSYTEKNNKRMEFLPHLPVIVACDFNAQEKPMSWVIGQRHKQGNTEITYWHKALSFQYTNTLTMCKILDEEHLQSLQCGYPKQIIFYGDYAGRKHTSNSSTSDWEIIENYFSRKTRIEKRIKPCISIRDSIGATNAQLCNSKEEIRQYADPVNCAELIKDWEYCAWKDNGRELDERDPLRTHLCRAVDYYNEYEYSIRGRPEAVSFRTI
ncbi:MAG TPA: hypothetical protein PK605_01615 [Ignavibacteria bacterium]|nr:hypothetical protein [Bacteroidota bacterium]HRE11808.1 hypothetical protein [Ignavibacteria bacterium]HRF67380.1 hypothetical protein [Ignavibacteria bacterium]HRJ03078.1 hypothetical protein [Ignavibacteria bacterium]HRJ84741.1 hypothetical protein [Ignavibacteria bacterium]